MSVPCGADSSLYQIAIYYSTQPDATIDISAVDASLLYVENAIQPIKEEIKAEVSSIGYAFVFMLIFIILLVLIIMILWLTYELNIDGIYVIIMLILIIVIALIIFILVARRAVTTIEDVIDDSLKLSQYNTPQFRESLIQTINSSANVYQTAVGQPCSAPPPN